MKKEIMFGIVVRKNGQGQHNFAATGMNNGTKQERGRHKR